MSQRVEGAIGDRGRFGVKVILWQRDHLGNAEADEPQTVHGEHREKRAN
jgi:hypothetical protein